MPNGYLFLFGCRALHFASSVQSQGTSCYFTSTVIYGNSALAQSFAENATSLTGSTTSTSSLTLTGAPGFGSLSTFLNTGQASSLASEESTLLSNVPTSASDMSATASQGKPASSTNPSPTVSTLPSPLYIQVNTDSNAKVHKRSIEYVAFSGDNGILVVNQADAAIFELVDEHLMSGGQYVSQGAGNGYGLFEKSPIPPNTAQDWSSVGSAITFGDASFCYTSDDSFYIISSSSPPSGCQPAALTASVITPALTTSTVSMVGTSSASTAVIVPSTSASLSTTTNEPVQSSKPASSSVDTSTHSTPEPSSMPAQISSTIVPVQMSTSSNTPVPKSTTQKSTPASPAISPVSSSPITLSFSVSQPTSPLSASSTSTLVLTMSSPSTSAVSSVSPPHTTSVSSLAATSSLSTNPTTSVSSSKSSGLLSSSATSSTTALSSTIIPHSSSPSSSVSTSTTTQSTTTNPPSSSSTSTSTTSSTQAPRSSTSFASTSLHSTPTPLPTPGKRGLAYTNVNYTNLFSLPPQSPTYVSWCYDYYSLPNASTNNVGPTNPALTFVPLLYNDSPSLTSIWSANVNTSITNYATDSILAFNEPDACNNGQSACMSVTESVSAYKSFIQPFAGTGIKLGAPAVTNGGPPASLTYLSYFLGNCTGCTIDFIPIHWYASPYSFQYLMDYVKQAYQVGGGSQIWITELGMDSQSYNVNDVGVFMKNATTWLDAQSFVGRYAWFGDFEGYLINANGTGLSAQGLIWNTYSGGYVHP